ncbi:hypothetical protein ABW19_dt0202239 [Dactylella cylindrospora]|nr:hypothetical protein ABW19_dt0202239 [Dactylella cylindrospora]
MIRSTISRSLRHSRPVLRPNSQMSRTPLQPALVTRMCPHALAQAQSRRTLFTTTKPTAGKKLRGYLGRFGLAVAIVYWYNTSAIFAEEPAEKLPFISRAPPVEPIPEERFLTLDEHEAQRKAKAAATVSETTTAAAAVSLEPRSPESLEEEAGQQGAFNEETGEINWDCPCLGGMAHGPCGEEFREAFSCFVFSKEEPKGVDCIEKFKGMQNCFQKYPEIYGEPPADDEEEEEIDRKLAELDAAPQDPQTPSDKPSTEIAITPKPPLNEDSTPTGSLPHSPPQDRGTDEYTRPAPTDRSEPRSGTLGHPAPGSKGISGGSHEGPVDTDARTSGLIRPAPSNAGLENIGGHGAPGVRGVSDPSGPIV